MSILIKSAAFVAVISILLGYKIHHPIPNDVHEWFATQAFVDGVSLIEHIASAFEFLRFSNRWQPYRLYSLLPEKNESTDAVKIKKVILSGVDCLVFTPKEFSSRTTPGPAIVYYHGGGFVTGTPRLYSDFLIEISNETGFTIIAPDYRLAPEYPFPIPFEDCLNSATALIDNAADYNVDPSKVVLAGDSAGGNFAVSVALAMTKMNKNNYKPAMIVPLNPILQMADFRLPSYQQNKEHFFTQIGLPKFWLSYIGLYNRMDLSEIVSINGHVRKNVQDKLKMLDIALIPDTYKQNYNASPIPLTPQQQQLLNEDVMDKLEIGFLDLRIAPLMASDDELKKLPPAHIYVSEYDHLRDDGIILHERLKKLGKQTSLQMLSKSLHVPFILGLRIPNSYYANQSKILYETIKSSIK